MRCSFVHFGDVHLGTQQYDCYERLNDFGKAWLWACEYIANARPDFAVCTGDLFNRFTINPATRTISSRRRAVGLAGRRWVVLTISRLRIWRQ